MLIVLSLLSVQSAAARRLAREVAETFGREAVEAAEPRVLKLVEAYGDEAATVLCRACDGERAIQRMQRGGVREGRPCPREDERRGQRRAA